MINPNKMVVVLVAGSFSVGKWSSFFGFFVEKSEIESIEEKKERILLKRNMIWSGAVGCHLCVNGAFVKIIKYLRYYQLLGKEDAEENKSVCV